MYGLSFDEIDYINSDEYKQDNIEIINELDNYLRSDPVLYGKYNALAHGLYNGNGISGIFLYNSNWYFYYNSGGIDEVYEEQSSLFGPFNSKDLYRFLRMHLLDDGYDRNLFIEKQTVERAPSLR